VLWSPVGAPAGVPGPRRNADECDAGWFAPVATRRRPIFGDIYRLRRPPWYFPGCAPGPQAGPSSPPGPGAATAPLAGPWPPCPRLQGLCRPPIPTCGALSRPGHGPSRPQDDGRGREAVPSLAPPPSPAVTAQLAKQCTTGAHCRRGHFRTANRCVREGRTCRTRFAARSEINYFLVITESGYSGLLNVTMATAIMASPMTATIPRHTPIGTAQPPQVRPGTRACMADGGRSRWVNTACRMGYTT